MSATQKIQTTLLALRKAAGKAKTKKPVLESVDNIATSVVLLNSSSPSALVFDKLVSVFRLPLVSLYSAYTDQSLNAASAILNLVLNNIRSCSLDGSDQDTERQMGWERVANSLLSGVIDFLEDNNNAKVKTSIAKMLYNSICGFFFSNDDNLSLGTTIRCTAYMLLSDSATLHQDNQSKLRDQKLIGSRSLGMTIFKTRDFAVLEALLNLFAILLPASSTPQKRTSYIQDVFFNGGKDFVELLDGQPAREWDETATKVLNILASSDISFPQPFDVDEVTVGGIKYPQPEVSDRFYVDRAAFFVNVRREDGLYEDLQIKYPVINDIKFTPAGEKMTLVNVSLKNPPKLGDEDIPTHHGNFSLLVEIQNSDIPRFKEALRHRNLDKALATSNKPRISVSGDLDLDADGLRWNDSDQLSSEKVKAVETFYGPDPPSDKQHTVGRADEFEDVLSKAAKSNVSSSSKDRPPEDTNQSISNSKLKASIFGKSDEELSDIGDEEQVQEKSKTSQEPPQPRKKSAVNHEVIVLSDNDSVAVPNKTTVGIRDTEKRLQKRHIADKDATRDEVSRLLPSTVCAKKASSKVVPSKDKLASEPQPGNESAGDTPAVAKKVAPSGRARRTAAANASKKLADAFPSSEDTRSSEKNEDSSPAARVYKSKVNNSRLPEPGKPSERPPSPIAEAIRSSSPTSKVSKMKSKNGATKNKPIKAGQKRTADKAPATEEETAPRKKPKVNVKNVDEKVGQRSTYRTQKSGKRGRNAKDQAQQETTEDSQNFTEDTGENVLQEMQTPIRSAKMSKTGSNKENFEAHGHESRVLNPIEHNKEKAQASPRPALRTLPHSSNVVSSKSKPVDHTSSAIPPAHKKLDAEQGDESTLKRNSPRVALRSLEDVLLKGIPVKEDKAEQKANEVNHEESNDPETNLDFGQTEICSAEQVSDLEERPITPKRAQVSVGKREADLAKPRTPLSSKPVEETPIRREPLTKPSRNTLDLDTEFADLTDEDIREVLETLRARRSKKQPELGLTGRLQVSKRRTPFLAEEESPAEDVEATMLREIPSRNKVKFDEKLRYKSASLESLPDRETGENIFLKSKARKGHAKSESGDSGSRGSNRRQQKGQETKNKKDPAMQDIIKVLDEIQNVIVSNIENKSRAVRSDIRIARDHLIHEAAADLHEMREESVGHYNNLLALENEYANINRKVNEGFENVATVNADICRFIRQNLSTHDRGSLPKKMAPSLFASSLPACFQKYI